METTFTEWLQIAVTLLLIGGGVIGVILLAFLPNWEYEEDGEDDRGWKEATGSLGDLSRCQEATGSLGGDLGPGLGRGGTPG